MNQFRGVLRPMPVASYKDKPIDYIDPAPKPQKVQIPLVEYFERMKRHKADRWQHDFCRRLQEAAENRHIKGVFHEYHAEPRLGKPLDIETLVLMGDGSYKRLGDIQVGDYVIAHSGLPRKVLQVFEQGELDSLCITTNCARSVNSALDHPFLTPEGWVEAKDLRVGHALGCVPEAKTDSVCSRSNEEYEMLGYFIGDGCVAKNGHSFACNITSGDDLLTQRLLTLTSLFDWRYNMFRKPNGNCDTISFSHGAREWVRATGIAGTNSWTKRVPEWVFAGTREQIGHFLGAYFACDGTFGRQRNTVIDFGSVSIGLLQDVQKLLLRVGVQSRVAIKNGVYKGAKHQSHRLYFCNQDAVAQFIANVPIQGIKGIQLAAMRSHRKTFQPQYLTDNIVSIESIGKRPCRCLEVEIDHTFTANDFIVHNTSILSQTFPAWLFGHDPLFRYALAMYNITQSQSHSDVIIQMMRSALHKEIFPNKDGWLPTSVSKAGWMTNARRDAENGQLDGQKSLNPVGLESGLTGGGMDWLTIDDPYKDPKEAFSETMWTNLDRFWQFGVQSRLSPYTCVASMFHRYSETDFGGYLLDTGDFEYIRYATVLEKPEDLIYLHEATGQRFLDPLGRGVGEYISERRGAEYYEKNRKNTKVWNSMFIGVPRTEETDFFHVHKIEIITDEMRAAEEWAKCIAYGRGWDNAATEGSGDFSASALAGIQPDGTLLFADTTMEQLDTGGRMSQQTRLAAEDGTDVVVCIPKDKAASGKDVVFFTTQILQGYVVEARDVSNAAPGSNAKARRAYNLSVLVNTGKVKFLHLKRPAQPASYVPGSWIKSLQRAMQGFLQGGNDDIIDAAADVTSYLFEKSQKGRVVQGLSSVKTWVEFLAEYGVNGKIPEHWTVYAAVKISAESHTPNCGVIIARAPQNTGLPDSLFVLAEYKEYDADYPALFTWLDTTLKAKCENPKASIIHLHKNSAAFWPTIRQKLEYTVWLFSDIPTAGISEINWYGQNGGLVGLIDDIDQIEIAKDSNGLASIRQEQQTWGFNDKGEPNGVGQVWDAMRMIAHAFRTTATGFTIEEKIEQAMPDNLRAEVIATMPMSHDRDSIIQARLLKETVIRKEMNQPVRSAAMQRLGRR